MSRMDINQESVAFVGKLLELCNKNKSSVVSHAELRNIHLNALYIQSKLRSSDYGHDIQPSLRALMIAQK